MVRNYNVNSLTTTSKGYINTKTKKENSKFGSGSFKFVARVSKGSIFFADNMCSIKKGYNFHKCLNFCL